MLADARTCLHVGPRRVGEEYVLELESALGLRRLRPRLGQGVNVERLISEAEDLCGSLLALPSILRVAGDLTHGNIVHATWTQVFV